MSSPMKSCPYCGQQHRVTARFCPQTGQPLALAQSPSGAPLAGEAPLPLAPALPTVEPATPAPGTTGKLPPQSILNQRYIILQKIGQGGMAAVYQALDQQQPGRLWAIKEMSDAAIPNPADRAYAVQTFMQEAQLLQQLSHPNLPKVIDVFTAGEKHYLVMEYVPGQTLQAMLEARGQPFSEQEVISWALQLCEVLKYLHGQKPPIIFRDLKPANIMITPEGTVKLIDFGIVRFFKPGKTKDTMALGTPGYAAPEAAGGQTDERSDLYSLCVTLHQLLTLNDPGRTIFNLPPVRRLNPAVSPALAQVIERGVQNMREFRWPNAAELQQALASLGGRPAAAAPMGYVAAPAGVAATAAVSGGAVPVPPTMSAPSVVSSSPAISPGAPPLAQRSGRPTTRLLMMAAQLSPRQVAMVGAGLLFALVLAAYLLTDPLASLAAALHIDLNNIPLIAVFGALGYAAFPRRGVAFMAHTLFSLALVATIWSRAESQDLWDFYGPTSLILGALISGAVMEGWVAFLPRIKDRPGGTAWQRELVWLCLMEVVGTALFFAIVTRLLYGLNPSMWFMAALFGAAGWFLGDMLRQYLIYRQTGLWPER